MLVPKVRVVVTKAAAIKTVVIAMVGVMGRAKVRPIPWMPVSSRCIQLIPLKGSNQGHLVIMSIGFMRFSQKNEFNNCSLYSIA